MTRRANPERTLNAILNSPDRATALARLTTALRNTWESGYSGGWNDGVEDATNDDGHAGRPNPYDKEKS